VGCGMGELLSVTHAMAGQVMVWTRDPGSVPIGSTKDVMIEGRRVSFEINGGQSVGDSEVLVWGSESLARCGPDAEPQEPGDVEEGLRGQLEALRLVRGQLEALRLERDHAVARAAEAEALHMAWTWAGLPPGTLVERCNEVMRRAIKRQQPPNGYSITVTVEPDGAWHVWTVTRGERVERGSEQTLERAQRRAEWAVLDVAMGRPSVLR
jgi:hypothetical protein